MVRVLARAGARRGVWRERVAKMVGELSIASDELVFTQLM